MFIHGLHIVEEIRDRVSDGDSEAATEIYLSREKENGSSILVAFSGQGIVTLTVIGAQPQIGLQYSLPSNQLESFLRKFPLGSLVSSSVAISDSGQKTLTLRRVADEQLAIASPDFMELISAPEFSDKSKSIDKSNFDGRFVHIWDSGNRKYEFKEDGSYFVLESLAYSLSNNGMRLDWGPMQFDRISGNANEVVGHWLSIAGDEDVVLRADGTYTWHFAGSFPDALGTWAISNGKIESAELRANCTINGTEIVFDAVYSGTYTGDFAFSDQDKTLTIGFNGTPVEYTRP
ncbi:MAG: hypothetical protein AAF429_03965 [Pseudomonadota bacterium]